MNNNQRAAYLRGVADEVRLDIVELLAQHDEMSVTALTELLALAQPTVSKHLAAMRTSEVVTVRRKGTQRLYRLHEASMQEFQTSMYGLLRRAQTVNHKANNPR